MRDFQSAFIKRKGIICIFHLKLMYNEKNRLILTATLIYRLIFIYGGTLSEERLSPIPLSKDFFS